MENYGLNCSPMKTLELTIIRYVSVFSGAQLIDWSNVCLLQWMVIDTKLFVPGKPIQPNTLWIIEQIPGFTQRYADRNALRVGFCSLCLANNSTSELMSVRCWLLKVTGHRTMYHILQTVRWEELSLDSTT